MRKESNFKTLMQIICLGGKMIRELVLVYKILKWHQATFEDLSEQSQRIKLDSEIKEYMQEVENYTRARTNQKRNNIRAKINSEMIDVIIAGINCLRYPETFERVAVKHNINTHRNWKGVHHDVSAK